MRLLHKVITGLLVALGCLHVALTPFNYKHFDMEAMWFVSAGVAIILAGFLNVAVIRAGNDFVIRILCALTNITFAVLFVVALVQMAQPQVFVGMALFVIASVCALFTSAGKKDDSA